MIGSYHHTNSLMDAIDRYVYLGYSVIPVRENKSPVFKWKSNQSRRDDVDFLCQTIQKRKDVAGLGIVTGPVSQLAVLDFDDLNLYYQFKERFSHLTETYMVRTRRGYHLYYHVDPDLNTQTHKCNGVDWLYTGSYVIAPPSIISSFRYQIEQPMLVHRASETDLHQIHQFLDEHRSSRIAVDTVGDAPASTLLPEEAVRLYIQQAPTGRNNALFRVTMLARDCGWTQATAAQVLLDTFALDNPDGEDLDCRYREGQRTIASAFSRPRRIRLVDDPTGLPNTVREALLARQMTCAVRTLEGLRQKGILPGRTFTEADARQLLSGIVGEHSIRKTLVADICKTQKNSVANKTPEALSLKCFEISRSKSQLNPRGRPVLCYIMPSDTELADWLNVSLTSTCDPLAITDLVSAKATRKAMHRELIRRRPGVYPARWLASRLHISISTKNRYEREMPVQKSPTYRSIPLTRQSCGFIDESNNHGIFIEDRAGKRYPPRIDLAKYLLNRGRGAILKIQSYNFYSLGLPTSDLPAQPTHRWQYDEPSKMVAVMPPKRAQEADSRDLNRHKTQPTVSVSKTLSDAKEPGSQMHISTGIEDRLAHRLHQTILQLGQTTFSLRTARRLIASYGVDAVRYAIQRLKTKKTITNPAGLLTVIARSYRYL